jgi:hypothetical protein
MKTAAENDLLEQLECRTDPLVLLVVVVVVVLGL